MTLKRCSAGCPLVVSLTGSSSVALAATQWIVDNGL